MNLSLENVQPHFLVRYLDKKKKWQFICQLITGRNVKDLSLENILPHFILVQNIK